MVFSSKSRTLLKRKLVQEYGPNSVFIRIFILNSKYRPLLEEQSGQYPFILFISVLYYKNMLRLFPTNPIFTPSQLDRLSNIFDNAGQVTAWC